MRHPITAADEVANARAHLRAALTCLRQAAALYPGDEESRDAIRRCRRQLLDTMAGSEAIWTGLLDWLEIAERSCNRADSARRAKRARKARAA